jgi:hypothetical protein
MFIMEPRGGKDGASQISDQPVTKKCVQEKLEGIAKKR